MSVESIIEDLRKKRDKLDEMIAEIEGEADIYQPENMLRVVERVKSRPPIKKFKTGVWWLDQKTNGGISEASFINLAGENFGGKCVDGDTEFLSESGWIKIKDYNGEKVARYCVDGTVEFVYPEFYFTSKTDKFYHIKGKQIDMMVTASHRIPYTTYKSSKVRIDKFEDLYVNGKLKKIKFINSFNMKKDDGIYATEYEIRLMVALYADGAIASKGTSRWRVRLKKEKKKERLRMLLKKSNVDYREEHYGKDKSFSDFVFYFTKCTKDMTELYKSSSEQLRIIVDEFVHWDGTIDKVVKKKTKVFFTSKKEFADFMSYAISATGSRAITSVTDRRGQKHTGEKKYEYKSVEYEVRKSVWKNSTSENTKVEEVYGTQDCYCFTMGESGYNDMWVARRKNYIFVTGNTYLAMKILENITDYERAFFFSFEMYEGLLEKRVSHWSERQLAHLLIEQKITDLYRIAEIIRLQAKAGVQFFVIDSRMKITMKQNLEQYARNSEITRVLSKVTQETGATILLINQISESDLRNGRLSLKGSGDQAYDSDMIIYIAIEKDKENNPIKRHYICTKDRINERTWRHTEEIVDRYDGGGATVTEYKMEGGML